MLYVALFETVGYNTQFFIEHSDFACYGHITDNILLGPGLCEL